MTEVRFYHLTRRTLEDTLPVLLARTLERGQKAVVMTRSAERAEALAARLWDYDDRSFLPHGTKADGHPELQPVWITDRDERPNGAQVMFLTDGARTALAPAYALVCELIDGADEAAVSDARSRWLEYREAGFAATYHRQDEKGWQKAEQAGDA